MPLKKNTRLNGTSLSSSRAKREALLKLASDRDPLVDTLVTRCRVCYSVTINTTRITPEAFQNLLCLALPFLQLFFV